LMSHDKKVDAGKIRFILLRSIGEAMITDHIPSSVLASVLGEEGVDAH